MFQGLAQGLVNHLQFLTPSSQRLRGRARGDRLVFVGGAPRSGTTLVQHILDSNAQVFGGPEFDCIPALMQAWREVLGALHNGRITVFCTRAQVDAAFAGLIEELLLPVADSAGARWLSEKTPLNVLHFCDLLTLLPECHAVHIVRDPRAVVASLLQVGRRAREKNAFSPPTLVDVQAAVDMVGQAVNGGFHAQHLFPQRVLTLTYETLVAEPEPVIRRLCAFLGLTFEQAMLEPHARKHPSQDALVALDNGVWLDPQLGFRAIETSRIDAWRNHLDDAQLAVVHAAFKDHPGYRSLGYSFEASGGC